MASTNTTTPLSFTANIDKETVERVIREEVRALLVSQLDNVVAGEMAKMKLFKPGSSDLATMITNKVQKACSQAMGQESLSHVIRCAAESRARRVADEQAVSIAKELRDSLKSRMKSNLKTLVENT